MHYMHYTHNMHDTRNIHDMHDTPLHEQFYQYNTPLHERFNEYTHHYESGLIRFIARTVGRRRQPP